MEIIELDTKAIVTGINGKANDEELIEYLTKRNGTAFKFRNSLFKI